MKLKPKFLFSVALVIGAYSCSPKGSGSQINTHAEQTQSVSIETNAKNGGDDAETTEIASESSETNDNQPRNTRYADEHGRPRYAWTDVHGRLHTTEYAIVEVKPLLNGKEGLEELQKYLRENFKIEEIAKENGIREWRVGYQFFIGTDGSVIDAKIREESTHTHPLLDAELLRLINATHGKWTPGKQDGDTIRVRLVVFGMGFRASE